IGNATNGKGINFDLTITDNTQTLNFAPIILVGTPMLSIKETILSTPPSLPGQTESLYVVVRNTGFGFGHSAWAELISFDPYISVVVDSVWFGEIYPESIMATPQPLVVSISSGCPSSYLARLPLTINADIPFYDTIQLLIGETGFSDDIETGGGLWTSGGTNNLWHISTRRSFSPTHSWYCGNESGGQYVNNMNCYIQTIPFMVHENSLLRFYRWFSVPIYGTDGIYVIVMHNNVADTLDFIGTGGALEQRPIQSNWFEEKYLLSDYSAGDTIQLRIAFISDNDGHTGEGFYIDNVNVEYVTNIDENIQDAAQNPELAVYPNPFTNQLAIKFQIPNSKIQTNPKFQNPNKSAIRNPKSEISLMIYDVSGRVVKSFNPVSGILNHESCILWSGDDDAGRKLPAGVYFVELRINDYKKAEKVILLR
ncbi:MAG: hypothetical protein ABIL22_03540, partial [candidate division WOR-3 bacterium]